MGKYIGFCLYCRSYLLWSPVIVYLVYTLALQYRFGTNYCVWNFGCSVPQRPDCSPNIPKQWVKARTLFHAIYDFCGIRWTISIV